MDNRRKYIYAGTWLKLHHRVSEMSGVVILLTFFQAESLSPSFIYLLPIVLNHKEIFLTHQIILHMKNCTFCRRHENQFLILKKTPFAVFSCLEHWINLVTQICFCLSSWIYLITVSSISFWICVTPIVLLLFWWSFHAYYFVWNFWRHPLKLSDIKLRGLHTIHRMK